MSMTFKAVKASNVRNGEFLSLRVRYATSRLPGDGSSEFGRIRQERAGWNAWASDEEMDSMLKAAIVRVGRNAPLSEILAACRSVYMRLVHPDSDEGRAAEAAYEAYVTERDYEEFVASHGDATGAGQDFDCNAGL